MDVIQKLEIERECANVLLQCRRHADQQEYEKAAALFTPDVFFKSGDSDPTVGREANIAAMHANIGDLFMRCVITNILVTIIDADHATATSYWQMYVHKKADVDDGKVKTADPSRFCESEDKFVRTDEGWLIAQRIFNRVL
jgi:hypothetical protein